MAWYLRIRERFRKPRQFIESLGIKEGDKVLDYGCGIGSYTIPAAKIVGDDGKVYALDIHPVAIERVEKRARKAGVHNIETIQSDIVTGLPDEYLEFTLLIDVYTWVDDKDALLQEMHRILKPSGQLVFLIDHVSPEGCKRTVDESGLFRFDQQEENILRYTKL
jgi:ubiquinone/menaquinone biosynthesis C-methylase UbiE